MTDVAGKKLNFEQSMVRLEQIVNLLERGEAPLEEALALFEEGTKLMRTCSGLLDKAEQQVALLKVGPEGQPEEVPFQGEG